MVTSVLTRTEQPGGVPPRRTLVVGIAGWSLKHPVIAIAGWLALVVMCVLGGNLAGMNSASDAQVSAGEAGRAASMVQAAGLQGRDTESVLLTARPGAPGGATLGEAAAGISRALAVLPMVDGVAKPIRSADHTAMLIQVTVADGVDDPKPLLAAVSGLRTSYPQIDAEVTGGLTINADVNDQLGRDFSSALVLSLPITILILLVAFGALLAAGVPVLLGVGSVLSAVGLYTVASHVFPDGGSTAELILLIGMAVGVDYSLFYLKRAREERQAGRSGQDALRVAAATAGHAVVISGCAVMVAMAGLFLLHDVNFSALAVGGIIVVALAVLSSLTVLPAILGLLGERVDRPRIPILSRLTMSGRAPRVWPLLLRPALRFPALTLLIGVAGMVLLALPATTMHLKSSTVADLPQALPGVVAMQHLTAAFPDQRSGLTVVAHGEPSAVATVVRRIETQLPGHRDFGPEPTSQTAGGTTVLSVAVPYSEDSDQARAALAGMRSTVIPAALQGVGGVDVAVGGSLAANVDYVHELSSGAPLVVGFVILMTFVLMIFTFRSPAIGLVTIAANLLSAGAAFGVLVLVFQSQWGASLLGFHLSGGIIAWIPVFVFVILFGLSMDYHVLVVSRIKEGVDRGLSTRDAVREGVTASASVITSAAAVMVGVFAIFAGLHMVEFKELGVGLGAAILLDALVVRILILPALMLLLGRANWWAPAFLRRRRSSPGIGAAPSIDAVAESGTMSG